MTTSGDKELIKREWWKSLDLTWKRIFKLSIDINHNPTNEELDQILKLESIDCSNSYILSLEPLEKLKGLRKLNCSKTKIRTLDKIQNLTLIDELDCSNTDISTLEPIRDFKNLWSLNCSKTNIKSLKGTETLHQLAYLNCSANEINNLEPLIGLDQLKSVNCDNTMIVDLEAIKHLDGKIEISYNNTLVQEEENSINIIDLADRDSLFEEAARLIVQHQQASTTLFQRKLKLGYNRAGRLMDQLEAAGVVGPFEGSKAREVLIKDPLSIEELLNHLERNPNDTFYSNTQKQNPEEDINLNLNSMEVQRVVTVESSVERKEGLLRNFIRSIFNI